MISEDMQALIKLVTEQNTIRESFTALITGAASQIEAAAGNRAATQAVAADLRDVSTSLAEAVDTKHTYTGEPKGVPAEPVKAEPKTKRKKRAAKKGK
jgi:hypothetical protein